MQRAYVLADPIRDSCIISLREMTNQSPNRSAFHCWNSAKYRLM
ncbi:hypothetical protein AQPE_0458 [Aquipluma nitroreducens]|uniref:Uncharacterized protein n=1 Tax=Aquipluma nitroreducens TaxID=2010828 RepID=A0A5K7S422_9BACT|nr:hypothetical protein AQPE_0458 [Aquipluma nitroreducens]